MKSKELLETYPKVATLILAHQTAEFIKSLDTPDMSPEFREFAKTQELDYETVASFMDVNPRGVFDVFDEYSVYIQISLEVKPYENVKFKYSISGENSVTGSSISYSTRIEAERDGIERAFEILNDKL